MAFEKIIVLDDELIIRKTLQEHLRKRRYAVAACESIREAKELLKKDDFDLIFVDIGLPDGEGTELLDELGCGAEGPMVVMMTGDGSIQSAVECMRKGAFDYIAKPFELSEIDMVVKKAEAFSRLVKVNRFFSEGGGSVEGAGLIGESKPISQLKEMVKKVAATEATVLIMGENGTGKELIAQELYSSSPRAGQAFIKVNCAAISETLMESEFFGHEKGAFTGATQRREGRFELADGGTILLDEISEISPNLQAKLLRVLQEREFERVGGNSTIKVDVRVLATTNRNLMKCVEAGEFREDLYYRLNVFPINVPALRDRGGDIMLLAEKFLERFSRKHGKKLKGFGKKAIMALSLHDWPGNVRELQNTVERAVILSDEGKAIEEEALGLIVSGSGAGKVISLEDMEREHILKAMKQAGGVKKEAAKLLDVNIQSLTKKLNQYSESGESVA